MQRIPTDTLYKNACAIKKKMIFIINYNWINDKYCGNVEKKNFFLI